MIPANDAPAAGHGAMSVVVAGGRGTAALNRSPAACPACPGMENHPPRGATSPLLAGVFSPPCPCAGTLQPRGCHDGSKPTFAGLCACWPAPSFPHRLLTRARRPSWLPPTEPIVRIADRGARPPTHDPDAAHRTTVPTGSAGWHVGGTLGMRIADIMTASHTRKSRSRIPSIASGEPGRAFGARSSGARTMTDASIPCIERGWPPFVRRGSRDALRAAGGLLPIDFGSTRLQAARSLHPVPDGKPVRCRPHGRQTGRPRRAG